MTRLDWEKQKRKEAAYRSRGVGSVPDLQRGGSAEPQKTKSGPAVSLPEVEWYPIKPVVTILSDKKPRKKKNRRQPKRFRFEGEAFSRGVVAGRIRERQLIIDMLKANGFAKAAKRVSEITPIKPPKW